MEEFVSLKRYAQCAKSRMLKTDSLPSFVGKVPYKRYEKLLKIVSDNELLCRICQVIENGNEINPMSYIIDKNYLDSLSPSDKQRYVFRLAEIYRIVKNLLAEAEEERKFG